MPQRKVRKCAGAHVFHNLPQRKVRKPGTEGDTCALAGVHPQLHLRL